MWNHSREQLLFNQGWEHLWFNPKNVSLKEIVKGPFLNPKLLFPAPYVTLHQQDGNPIRLHNGIPDCWAEYLVHNSTFLRDYLGNYELMQKEDVEVVPQLRKNYRLYIGQGIPDPWLPHPNLDNTEIIPRRSSKSFNKFLHFPKNKKSNCYCCEKKYLFECPDKNSVQDCPCINCHGRGQSPNCGENCKCISRLRDWVLKNTHVKRGKKPRRRKSPNSDLSSSNESKTEDEEVKYDALRFCNCLRHSKDNDETTTSETEGEYNEKPHNNKQKTFPKNQSRLCCCPYVNNFYLKNFSYQEKNCPECKKTISKEIQTESPPHKDSKIVQTDNSKRKLTRVCYCSSKCSRCGLFQCKMPWSKLAYSAINSVPNMCFTPNVFHNSAIICPYSFPNHFLFQKLLKHDECKKLNKKQQKNKVCKDDSDFEVKDHRRRHKEDEENTKKSESRNPTGDLKNDDINNRNIYCCQAKGLEHFKYLTDERLKAYIQREDRFPEKSTPLASKFINFCRGDQSVTNSIPERYQYDRFKAFSQYKSKLCDSFEGSRKMRLGYSRYPSKLLSSSDQATMTAFEETEKYEKGFSKLKCLKNMVESDESKACAQGRDSDEPHRTNRRRRRLLANRKRRRKLAASSRATILEYQALLDKMSKSPQLVSKHVQAEGTYQSHHYFSKTLSENDSLPPRITNFCENPSLRFKVVSLNSSPVRAEIVRKTEGSGKNHLGERLKNGTLEESLRPSLRVDMKFSKALEKISDPNKGVWTSSALKNIVDNLLTEKKPEHVNLRV